MGFCRILNTYADYWEAQEKGTLTPVSVVERREKLLGQIEEALPKLIKLAQTDGNHPSMQLMDGFFGGATGGDRMSNLPEDYARGLANTVHGLSAMHAGLKAGWSMDDLNLLALFYNSTKDEERIAYQSREKVEYKPGERQFLDSCEDFMKKVSSHPIKNATDRKAMLSEMKELFDRGAARIFSANPIKQPSALKLTEPCR